MSSFDVHKLQDLYDSFSRAEYHILLLKVVADLKEHLSPLPLKYQIKYRVKDFRSYFKKIANNSPKDKLDITDLLGRGDFRSALELDKENFRAWYNLGMAHKVLQEFNRAIEAFAKSSELNPAFLEPDLQRIRLLLDFGEYFGAREAFGELQKYHPEVPEVRLLQKEIMSK